MRLKFFGELDLLQSPAVSKESWKAPAQITPREALEAWQREAGGSASLVLPGAEAAVQAQGGEGDRPESQRSSMTELINETADLMNTLPPKLARKVRA